MNNKIRALNKDIVFLWGIYQNQIDLTLQFADFVNRIQNKQRLHTFGFYLRSQFEFLDFLEQHIWR